MHHIQNKQMVIPGEILAQDERGNSSVFREDNNIISPTKGQARIHGKDVKVIPINGIYIPKVDDVIIAVVQDILMGRWMLDINAPYKGFMRGEEATKEPLHTDLSTIYQIGDVISCRVGRIDEVYYTEVIKPWKLNGGRIISINPKKVPRVVGRKRSMLELLKKRQDAR